HPRRDLRRADLSRRLVRARARGDAGAGVRRLPRPGRLRPAPPRPRAAEPRARALPALPRPGDGAPDPRLPRPRADRGLRLAAGLPGRGFSRRRARRVRRPRLPPDAPGPARDTRDTPAGGLLSGRIAFSRGVARVKRSAPVSPPSGGPA